MRALWSLEQAVKPFREPDKSIGVLDAVSAANLVASSSDVALVMNDKGIIQDMAIQPSDLSSELEGYGRWFGRPWADTVSAESRPKVASILAEATRNTTSAWRQLTHKSIGGRDVSILYSAVKIGSGDRFVAVGRDMRAVSALQQRLIDAQMSLERDFTKQRFAETRYRLLFQNSSEPVLILDSTTLKIVEANPAAATLLERGTRRLVGRTFGDLFTAASRARVQQSLSELRSGGRKDDDPVTLADAGDVVLAGAVFRQDSTSLLLIRLLKPRPMLEGSGPAPDTASRLAEFVQASPDAFVVADAAGHIITANAAFAEMTQVADKGELSGASLERWFGRPGVDLDLAAMNLRQHGTLRLFSTFVRGTQGGHVDVEVSAVSLGQGNDAKFAYAIRDVGRRLSVPARPAQDLPHSAAQLTELIGRVPLKELVRETTDVIEKLCIEAALDLTGDNRASAAEVLGLSRQSLYVKLRRYGLADATVEEGDI